MPEPLEAFGLFFSHLPFDFFNGEVDSLVKIASFSMSFNYDMVSAMEYNFDTLTMFFIINHNLGINDPRVFQRDSCEFGYYIIFDRFGAVHMTRRYDDRVIGIQVFHISVGRALLR